MTEHREPIAVVIRTENPNLAESLATQLRSAGCRVLKDSETTGTEETRGVTPQVVIQDAGDAPAPCSAALESVRSQWPGAQIVFIGAGVSSDLTLLSHPAVFAALSRDDTPQHVCWTVQRAGETARMRTELTALRESAAMSYGFDNFIGVSEGIVRVRETAQRLAPTDIAVLLTGRPGSGKRHLATIIHHHSLRRRGPLVTVDFETVPPDQHSELLFGGTTAGRRSVRPGLLERADGGTIYLDDIGAMSMEAQERLSGFLQDHQIVSSVQARPMRLDVRMLAGSSHDLRDRVADGSFRADVLQALSVISIDLPPLKGRSEDIEVLTDYMLHRLTAGRGQTQVGISREALTMLAAHSWPGNVRELENTLRRAIALCQNRCIEWGDIVFLGEPAGAPTDSGPSRVTLTIKGGLLDNTQRTLIIKALDANDWNYSRTAADLGIGRTTLWRKIRRYDLRRESDLR
ncbi:MAG: sigma 54-interacting transcriptional regulator [candidate division Zixibacteria bacterium]|jgi:two-component system response regulator HydG|nr:sigma 54-interacting transcriptional regulator [candidate division Zixibacteria bacterium]